MVARGLGRADDVDAEDAPAVRRRVVVEHARELPGGGDGVDGAHELERLARDPARADDQQRLQACDALG